MSNNAKTPAPISKSKRLSNEVDLLIPMLERLDDIFFELSKEGNTTMEQRAPLLNAKIQIRNAISNIRNTSFSVRGK